MTTQEGFTDSGMPGRKYVKMKRDQTWASDCICYSN